MNKKISQNLNDLMKRIIARIFPNYYFNSFYKNNIGGTNWNGRTACFSLSFDCDYEEDIASIPILLDVLASYSFKVSFACIGKFIEKYPEEHMKIIRGGHEIINHTNTHPNNEELNPDQKFNELAVEQKKSEIEKCHKTCVDILGYAPVGFRAPHFGRLHTEDVYDVLKELGYKYSSSTSIAGTASFGLPFLKNGIIEFPLSNCPKHPLAVFDTWHSLRRGNGKHKKSGEFYGLFKKLIDIGINTNSYINLYFDPQDVVNLEEFRLVLDYIEERRGEIYVATYKEIFENIYERRRNRE